MVLPDSLGDHRSVDCAPVGSNEQPTSVSHHLFPRGTNRLGFQTCPSTSLRNCLDPPHEFLLNRSAAAECSMQDKHANIKVIRSIWRRTEKGYIKVRDLEPQKDVQGGTRTAGALTTFGSMAKTTSPSSESPRDHWLHQFRAARTEIIRKLFQMPGERERKERINRIARAQRNFLRWIKRG